MTVRQEVQVDARSPRGCRPLQVAVLGLGPRWRKRYGPALEGLRDLFHIQAVCDPIQEWADHEARRLGCAAAAGPTELLEIADIDALLLLEAPWYRLWPLELACRLGKPAFCAALPDETDSHADELLRQVKERRLTVMVAMTPQLTPAADRLRQLLAGPLGAARLVVCDWTQPGRARGAGMVSGALLAWCAAVLGSKPVRVLFSEVPSAGLASGLLEFAEGRALQITQRRVSKAPGSVHLRIVAEHGLATIAPPRRLCWSDPAGRHTVTLPRPVPVARRLLVRFHEVVTTGQIAEPDLEQAHRPLPWLRALARSRTEGRWVQIADCGLRIAD